MTADCLYARERRAGVMVSLATVYNFIRQYEESLLREISVASRQSWFDTNTSDHQHFFVEHEGRLIDVAPTLPLDTLPAPPAGMEIVFVAVLIRLRPAPAAGETPTTERIAMDRRPPP